MAPDFKAKGWVKIFPASSKRGRWGYAYGIFGKRNAREQWSVGWSPFTVDPGEDENAENNAALAWVYDTFQIPQLPGSHIHSQPYDCAGWRAGTSFEILSPDYPSYRKSASTENVRKADNYDEGELLLDLLRSLV